MIASGPDQTRTASACSPAAGAGYVATEGGAKERWPRDSDDEGTVRAMSSPIPGYLVCGIGLVLLAIAFVWGVVIGYYPKDLPLLAVTGLGGAGLALLGQRMFQAAQRQAAEKEIADREMKEL